jgi:hypothetical protein
LELVIVENMKHEEKKSTALPLVAAKNAFTWTSRFWPAYASLCAFELWLILNLSKTVLQDFPMLRKFVNVVGSVAPAVHHFDGVPENSQIISLVMTLSVFLILPKVALFVRLLRSDRMRNYRYLIVSPLTEAIPKSPKSFVSDPLRSDKANGAPELMQPISMDRRIFLSIVILLFSIGVGLVLPWVAWGRSGRPRSCSRIYGRRCISRWVEVLVELVDLSDDPICIRACDGLLRINGIHSLV